MPSSWSEIPLPQSPKLNRTSWLRWLPLALLLVAIASQALLMAPVNEDRQAGSGFAMFSSVDFGGSRAVVIDATAQGEPVTVQAPERFSDAIETLTTSPTEDRAASLAESLQELDWSVTNGVATEHAGTGQATQIERVQVAVRGLTADGRTLGSQILGEGSGR